MTLPPVEQCIAKVFAGGCHLKWLDVRFAKRICGWRGLGGNSVKFLKVFSIAEITAEGWRRWCAAQTTIGGAGIAKGVVVGCCESDHDCK